MQGLRNNRLRKGIAIVLLLGCISNGCMTNVRAVAPTYRTDKTNSLQIALTFDDGPHPSQTKRILDILDRYGVRATFFMIGVNVTRYPEAAKEVARRGHEIGNHTFSHTRLQHMAQATLETELKDCEKALWDICSYRPRLFRPPEGFLNDGVLNCSETGEYSLILWSVDTRDWEVRDANQIAKTVLERIRPGDIVLLHDYVAKSKTPEALELFLPKLLELGYEPVTVSQLIGRG